MTSTAGIAAVILAAGRSTRMDTSKPLLRLGAMTAIEQAVSRFREAGVEDLTVVVGFRADEITPVLDRIGVKWVLNADFDRGMLSSVLAGIERLQPDVDAFFLLPADIPLIKPGTLRALMRAYRLHAAPVVYPVFLGLRGHPPLISRACTAGLAATREGGMREHLRAHEERAVEVAVTDEGVLMDCDTPEDYRKLRAYASREDIPTECECRAFWDRFDVPLDVRSHSDVVAEAARLLAVSLNRLGLDLDLDLVLAAGKLHDLAKGQPRHAVAGAAILEDAGYRRVARVVAAHTDIVPDTQAIREEDLVYLADKLVDGDELVSLDERFRKSFEKYANSPEIREAVRRRFEHAALIRERVQSTLECSVDELLARHSNALRMLVAQRRNIFLIRHGAIRLPEKPKRFVGQLDLALSDRGIEQSEQLRERLRHVRLSAVFCSDLARSRETAAIIARPHGLCPEARPEMREIALGEWDGLTFDEVREKHPAAFAERGRDIVHFRPAGGESFMDCCLRIIPSFTSIIRETRGDLAIIGHAGVNRIILCQILGRPLADLFAIEQDYGCVNVIRQDGFAFELVSLNEKLHLEEKTSGALP